MVALIGTPNIENDELLLDTICKNPLKLISPKMGNLPFFTMVCRVVELARISSTSIFYSKANEFYEKR